MTRISSRLVPPGEIARVSLASDLTFATDGTIQYPTGLALPAFATSSRPVNIELTLGGIGHSVGQTSAFGGSQIGLWDNTAGAAVTGSVVYLDLRTANVPTRVHMKAVIPAGVSSRIYKVYVYIPTNGNLTIAGGVVTSLLQALQV